MSIARTVPAVYAFGIARAHDDAPNALTYEPLPAEGVPAAAASEPWTEDERSGWLAAELSDMRRESEGAW